MAMMASSRAVTRAAAAAQSQLQSLAGPSNYWKRTATTWQAPPMTNQQERAIRLRQMAKRGDKDEESSSSPSRPPPQDRTSREASRHARYAARQSDREEAFHLSQSLSKIKVQVLRFEDDRRGTPPLEAYSKASALVESVLSTSPRITQRTIIYNQIIDLAARAGKGQLVMDLWTDMKKRGIWPNVATFTTIFAGFYRSNIDPTKATSLVRRLDAIFAEFDSMRQEALGGGRTPPVPMAKRHRRRGEEDEEEEEDFGAADDEDETSSRRQGYRTSLVRKLRDYPTDINGVLATYVRLMVKIGRPEAAWNVLDRMSPTWEPSVDGYPRMTKQVAGAWMNAIATTHPRLVAGQELPLEETERVIALWTRWRDVVLNNADDVVERYKTTWGSDAQAKEVIVEEWKTTIPSARQIVDVMELAAKSRSPRLCDIAMRCVIDFTDLPLPAALEQLRRSTKGPTAPQLRDPEHPLYMLARFEVNPEDGRAKEDEEEERNARHRSFREEPEQWDYDAAFIQESRRRATATSSSPSSLNLGYLLVHLQKVIHRSTLPDVEQAVGTILLSSAESTLASLPPSVREAAATTPLGFGGIYNRLTRVLLKRTALHSHSAWGAALHGASLLSSSSSSPLSIVRRIRETLAAMRRLYQCGLVSTPPDELHYKRAMQAISRQARYVGGQEALSAQAQVGQWWLEDRLEAAKTTSVGGRHGWMPWAETNGKLFAEAVLRVHAIVRGAEKRADQLSANDQERRKKQVEASEGERKAADEVDRAQGKEPRARIDTLFASARSLTEPLSPGNEAKSIVLAGLRLWRSSLTPRPEDKHNPYRFLDEVPFPKREMLQHPAPASIDYRETSLVHAGMEARGAGTGAGAGSSSAAAREAKEPPRLVMPDVHVWEATAHHFDSLLRIALDTGSQGKDVLPRDDVAWLKAMRERVREFLEQSEEEGMVEQRVRRERGGKALPVGERRRKGVPFVREEVREREVARRRGGSGRPKAVAVAWREGRREGVARGKDVRER